jgi:hypothetical protein
VPERISRPPARLRGGLPDGNLSGVIDVSNHFLSGSPGDRYAVVRLARRQLVHDDETGGDVAVLGVTEIEFPDQDLLQRMLVEHRDQRMASGQLPFDEPTSQSDIDKAHELQHRIRVWAEQNNHDARAKWVELFGPNDDEAPVGPTGGELPLLMEFVAEYGVVAQPLAAVPASPADDTVPDDEDHDDVPAEDEEPERAPGRVVKFSGKK